jgi:squalene-hopene/tetraprenyl-beta-curcumene cyclase
MRTACTFVAVVGIVFTLTPRAPGETNVEITGKPIEVPTLKYDPKEPVAAKVSLARSAQYLDNMAAFWMQRKKAPELVWQPSPSAYIAPGGPTGHFVPNWRGSLTSCGHCHANFSYLMVRPLLAKEFPRSQMNETRRFLEQRIAKADGLKREQVGKTFFDAEKGHVGYSALEYVSIATALAFHDGQTTGKLQPSTRRALTRMWAMQGSSGWDEADHCASMAFPIVEFDPYYGATLAALATGIAPEDYARTEEARAGLARLRKFFKANPAPGPHHKAMLLWASQRTEGLMTSAERAATIKELLKLQREDGGWSTAALKFTRDYRPWRFTDPASDGYGTAFVVYVLRQAGVPAARPEIVRGVSWLKTHQRVSGTWFTAHKLGAEEPEGGLGTRGLSVTNLATAFAVMALKACEEAEAVAEKKEP